MFCFFVTKNQCRNKRDRCSKYQQPEMQPDCYQERDFGVIDRQVEEKFAAISVSNLRLKYSELKRNLKMMVFVRGVGGVKKNANRILKFGSFCQKHVHIPLAFFSHSSRKTPKNISRFFIYLFLVFFKSGGEKFFFFIFPTHTNVNIVLQTQCLHKNKLKSYGQGTALYGGKF